MELDQTPSRSPLERTIGMHQTFNARKKETFEWFQAWRAISSPFSDIHYTVLLPVSACNLFGKQTTFAALKHSLDDQAANSLNFRNRLQDRAYQTKL